MGSLHSINTLLIKSQDSISTKAVYFHRLQLDEFDHLSHAAMCFPAPPLLQSHAVLLQLRLVLQMETKVQSQNVLQVVLGHTGNGAVSLLAPNILIKIRVS